MDIPLACHRCDQPGHGWRECDRPPAKTKQELAARISDITRRWDAGNGGFGRSVKARIVEIERNAHRNYEKEKAK